jgi:hypothetical protein
MKPPSARRVTAEGSGTGVIRCVTEDCAELYVKHPVELTFSETTLFQKDRSGSVTDNPESSWTHWHLKDDSLANCPSCSLPRNVLPPDARHVWEGTRKARPSELESLRKLRNAEVQRVEIVQPMEAS